MRRLVPDSPSAATAGSAASSASTSATVAVAGRWPWTRLTTNPASGICERTSRSWKNSASRIAIGSGDDTSTNPTLSWRNSA